jgi:NADPH-dependent curcumin reductase CurA
LKWLKESAGVDHAINYKGCDLDATFKKLAPEGISCYFDNVAGDFNYHVVRNMQEFGRISQCGSISTYNAKAGQVPLGN